MARRAAEALCLEGEAFFEQKKWDEALAAFRAAAAKDPEMSEAWFQIGYAENEKNGGRGKATEASHAPLAHCLKLDPKHAKAHYYLGRVLYIVRKDFKGAEASYREAIRFDPKYVRPHVNLGIVLQKLGKDADAEASYREVIRVDPNDAFPHWNLSFLLEKREDVDGAIVEIREYIRKGGCPGSDGEARLAVLLAKKAAQGGAASNGNGAAAPK